MLTGLQLHIKTLNTILPNSFVFVLDSTDRSFVYNSTECDAAKQAIIKLDSEKGIETLLADKQFYNHENDDHAYMIKRFSNHIFLGFFALKAKFSQTRIRNAKDFFLKME